MADDTVRVAVGLHLGAPICRPHNCHHCSLEVDSVATHGLNCHLNEGRHYCHATLNDIVHRALASTAKIPLVWNHLTSIVRMGNVLMALFWFLGRVGGCCSGM